MDNTSEDRRYLQQSFVTKEAIPVHFSLASCSLVLPTIMIPVYHVCTPSCYKENVTGSTQLASPKKK